LGEQAGVFRLCRLQNICLFFLILVLWLLTVTNLDNKMARTKRIAFSVAPEHHELLTKLAEYQKKTVTAVVTDFLEASIPAAEAMLTAFQELEKGVDQTEILKNLLATGLEGAAKNLRD
jgi:uncharacterized protein (DUF1778 family)